MNWKLKALAQSALSHVPCADTLNYWGQKFITRAHDPKAMLADRLEKSEWFLARLSEHASCDVSSSQFFEFGAGQDLAGPLALYCLGVNRQFVIDIRPSARLELMNEVIGELNSRGVDLPRVPGARMACLDELEPRFGIRYEAPADARATCLPASSVDCIVSTYTMEHIPAADLKRILAESRRILEPGGLMLSFIDYQDHYSYRDSRISVYNFLQYSERQWRWFNSPLHYQNRLRHSEYLRLFRDAGFEIVVEERRLPTADDLDRLRALRLTSFFERSAPDDLQVLGSALVSRRAPEREPAVGEFSLARPEARD